MPRGADSAAPRPRTGRRPGPTTTRDAILAAARRRFAEVGYDRATFRQIAAAAGVDPALVVQFFGSKQELFLAAVRMPDASGVLGGALEGDPATAGTRVARVLVGWLDDDAARSVLIARIRSAASEPSAAELVRQAATEQLAEVVRHLGGDHPDVRGALAASQFVGLVMVREVVGVEPLAALAPEELVELLGPTFQRYLTEPLALDG